jgi:mevalonate kinase
MPPTNSRAFAGRGRPAGDPGAEQRTEHGRLGVGRAHGKAILLGEHAVVYGAPALAIPVPQLTATANAMRFSCPGDGADKISFAIVEPGTASVTPFATDVLAHLMAEFKQRTGVVERMCVDVLIDCAIPQGRGLGSSAACARAAVLALADVVDRRLDARAVFDLVQASEKVAHGRASGIDALATGATSPLFFRAGAARELPIAMPGDGACHPPERTGGRADARRPSGFDGLFVIADSGVGGSTKDAVELLRRMFERNPETQEAFVRRVSSLTHAALRDLAHGQVSDFGARLTENHRLLHDVGISTDRIDALVEAALAAGSLGAKITGGGLGGCMIALAGDPRRAVAVVRRLHEAGAVQTWVIPVGTFAGHVH